MSLITSPLFLKIQKTSPLLIAKENKFKALSALTPQTGLGGENLAKIINYIEDNKPTLLENARQKGCLLRKSETQLPRSIYVSPKGNITIELKKHSTDLLGLGAFGVVSKNILYNEECIGTTKVVNAAQLEEISSSNLETLLREQEFLTLLRSHSNILTLQDYHLYEAKNLSNEELAEQMHAWEKNLEPLPKVLQKYKADHNWVKVEMVKQTMEIGRKKLMNLTFRGKKVAIHTEYCNGGSIAQKLADKNNPLTHRERVNLCNQLIAGVHYAHCNNICHYDLKPDNIFLHNGRVKIGDWGCSAKIDARPPKEGSPGYMDPIGDDLTSASDIYSLGINLYEIHTGEKPPQCLEMPVFANLAEKKLQELNENIFNDKNLRNEHADFILLLKSMWNPDPLQRPAIDEVLRTYQTIFSLHDVLERCLADFESVYGESALQLTTCRLDQKFHSLLLTPLDHLYSLFKDNKEGGDEYYGIEQKVVSLECSDVFTHQSSKLILRVFDLLKSKLHGEMDLSRPDSSLQSEPPAEPSNPTPLTAEESREFHNAFCFVLNPLYAKIKELYIQPKKSVYEIFNNIDFIKLAGLQYPNKKIIPQNEEFLFLCTHLFSQFSNNEQIDDIFSNIDLLKKLAAVQLSNNKIIPQNEKFFLCTDLFSQFSIKEHVENYKNIIENEPLRQKYIHFLDKEQTRYAGAASIRQLLSPIPNSAGFRQTFLDEKIHFNKLIKTVLSKEPTQYAVMGKKNEICGYLKLPKEFAIQLLSPKPVRILVQNDRGIGVRFRAETSPINALTNHMFHNLIHRIMGHAAPVSELYQLELTRTDGFKNLFPLNSTEYFHTPAFNKSDSELQAQLGPELDISSVFIPKAIDTPQLTSILLCTVLLEPLFSKGTWINFDAAGKAYFPESTKIFTSAAPKKYKDKILQFLNKIDFRLLDEQAIETFLELDLVKILNGWNEDFQLVRKDYISKFWPHEKELLEYKATCNLKQLLSNFSSLQRMYQNRSTIRTPEKLLTTCLDRTRYR
jgi:serine/threonine protein kinase